MGELDLSCCEVIDQLGNYADDDVDEALRDLIEAHFRDCPNCRGFFAQYRLTITLCKQLRA